MPQRDRLGPARTFLPIADVAITAAAPCIYLHAMPAAAAALVAAWDAPCTPVLVPAAIAVAWLLAVPVRWRSALHDAAYCIATLIAARRNRQHETCGNGGPVR